MTYSDAGTGTGEYVSAMLCDADSAALYYASLTSQGSGTWDLTIPENLALGSYTLKLFSEQQNGDGLTDYASDFVTIPLKYAFTRQSVLTAGAFSAFGLYGTASVNLLRRYLKGKKKRHSRLLDYTVFPQRLKIPKLHPLKGEGFP